MLVAILSDTHDNTLNLRRALQLAQEGGCTHLLFLGDMASVSTFRLLRELWPHEMQLVPGNNDYPRADFRAFAAAATPQTLYHGESADIQLDGRRIYMTHEPMNGVLYAAECGEFDLVLFGHTHQRGQQQHGRTIVANPGDLQGRYGEPSFAIYDTAAHELRHTLL